MPLTDRHLLYSFTELCIKSTLLLIVISFVSVGLQAQGDENKMLAEELSKSSEVTVPNPSQFFYVQKRRELSADANFEKFEVRKKQLNTASSYTADLIDRTYSINNPFDMEDLNNPFNLSRSGNRISYNSKKKESESFQKFLGNLFDYKQMPKKTIINKKPEMVPPMWMLYSLIAVLSVFAYQTVAFRAENKRTLQAFLSSSSALQQYRDQKTMFTPYKMLSDSLFVLSIGHFVYIGSNVYLHTYDMPYSWNFGNLILSVLGVSTVFFIKDIQSKVLGTIFPFKQQLSYNNFILKNTFRVLALSITPLLFLLTYSPETIKLFSLFVGVLLLASSGVYGIFRMTLASSEIIQENKFHFFIYLCAVELAPLLILLKLLSVI